MHAYPLVSEVAPGVHRVSDTCHVYLIVAPQQRTAVAVDFGSGRALQVLDQLGIDRITDVLMTHHHRDQAQGLPAAVEHGARIHVPPVELDLFADVEQHWAGRTLANDYNLRQDRFSILASVPVDATAAEYRTVDYAGVRLRAIPTPGHTTGSVSYLLDRDGRRLAFTGDLIYAPGQVWSLAATQWSYTGVEGPGMYTMSCYLLADEQPDLLLPSHGEPIDEPEPALGLLADRMQRYLDTRLPQPWSMADRLRHPFQQLTDHLLRNRSSNAYGYVLLSQTGEALFIDYGYDMTTGFPAGQDRAARRPWLASVPTLKRDHGVHRIAVALPTHYHDDHVAGMGLLREVEGTEIWAPATVAPIMADPGREDLPCQWYDPIVADRELAVGETFRWNEYEITVHDLPGHTLYHVGYEVEVDGVRVLFTGDQQTNAGIAEDGGANEVLNYQYRNRFRVDDYVGSAELYRRRRPELMLSGHWQPYWVQPGFLDLLLRRGQELADLHRELLPLDELDLGADGCLARLTPYRARVASGARHRLTATVRNPYPVVIDAVLVPVTPAGWPDPDPVRARLGPGEEAELAITVTTGAPAARARIGLDVTLGELRLGQHADAVIDVTPAP